MLQRRIGLHLALLACLALSACGEPTAPPLVSAQFPPGTGSVNANNEPQPIDSLPPGAANLSNAPGGVQRSYLTHTFGTGAD